MCDKTLVFHLKLISQNKNIDVLKNSRPINLLPIFGKVFRKIIFIEFFNYFNQNKLFMNYQSVFLHSDSCILHLLFFVGEINSSFDCDPIIDVSVFFLDVFKAFDKIKHDEILFKLRTWH